MSVIEALSNKELARKSIKEIIERNIKIWEANTGGSFSIIDLGVELQKIMNVPNNVFNRSWNATNLKISIGALVKNNNLGIEYFFKDNEDVEEYYTFKKGKIKKVKKIISEEPVEPEVKEPEVKEPEVKEPENPVKKITKSRLEKKPLPRNSNMLNQQKSNSIKFVRRLINNKTIINADIINIFNKTEFVDEDFVFRCMNHIYERMVQFNGLLMSTADGATKENYVGIKQNLMCAITILSTLNIKNEVNL